jgi:hypothetical protein
LPKHFLFAVLERSRSFGQTAEVAQPERKAGNLKSLMARRNSLADT